MCRADRKRKAEEQDAAESAEPIVPGRVLHFSGLGPNLTREDLKAVFEPIKKTEWIDFAREDTEVGVGWGEGATARSSHRLWLVSLQGHVRFCEEGDATAVKAEIEEKGTQLGGATPTLTVLEGDAEKVRGVGLASWCGSA